MKSEVVFLGSTVPREVHQRGDNSMFMKDFATGANRRVQHPLKLSFIRFVYIPLSTVWRLANILLYAITSSCKNGQCIIFQLISLTSKEHSLINLHL